MFVPGPGEGMSDRIRESAAPTLLVIVALSQLALVQLTEFSPWKGGGFGMFSSTDHGPARTVRVFALDETGSERRLQLPGRLRPLVRKVKHGPVRPLAQALAEEAAADARAEGDAVSRVRIRILRTDYGRQWLEPRRSLLLEMDFDVDED